MSLITITLHIQEEKHPGMGEDALFYHTADPNAAMIACMDGCGGSGGTRYPQFGNWTGARIASHLAGNAVCNWFQSRVLSGRIPLTVSADRVAKDLEAYLAACFRQKAGVLPANSSDSFSRLSRLFPTTLAAVLAESVGKNRCRIRAFWAGDSRAYYFPVTGLRQISRDNTQGDIDPFEDLIRDGIMNNVICADRPFRIDCSEQTAEDPCMILTATDGCFSYYLSPLYLEWVLLESLQHAASPREWEADLKMLFGRVAGDDYSMALAVIGFQNFTALQQAYAPRWEYFQHHYAQRLVKILEQGDEEAHRRLWAEYKKGYLPDIAENGS